MSHQNPSAFLCRVLGLDVLSQRAWSFSDIWMISTLDFALPDIYLNLTSCHKGHEAFQTTGYLPHQTLPCQILSFKLSPLRAVMQESYQHPSLDPSESANIPEWWTWRNSQEFRLLMQGKKKLLVHRKPLHSGQFCVFLYALSPEADLLNTKSWPREEIWVAHFYGIWRFLTWGFFKFL